MGHPDYIITEKFIFYFSVIFLAIFTQSLTGFGSALVAMAFLPGLIGLQTATPLVAIIAITLEVILLLRYRQALNIQAIWRLLVASLIGIPIGIYALKDFRQDIVLPVLGLIIAGYALYGLFQVKLPHLERHFWAYGFGLVAGMLGGAYNTSGPPVVVYADCRRWKPGEFKANLQGFFFLNSLLVVIGHNLAGNFSIEVWKYYLLAIPAIGLGIILGIYLGKRINPETFRKLVLLFLILMGLRIFFTSI